MSRIATGSANPNSVAYQINIEHTGYSPGPLHLPLKQLWAVQIGGTHGDVQYPIVANGIVVAIANSKLVGLDEKTGKKLWEHDPPNQFGWVGPAYDNGMVFTNAIVTPPHKNISVFGFDERTGKELWSAKSNGGGTAPTAAAGVVYSGALTAYDESTGAIKWMSNVGGGGASSSPVVTPAGIFVSYACPITFDLYPANGKTVWMYSKGTCDGGGGSMPVLYDNLLFVEALYSIKYTGLILNAKSGTVAGNFNTTSTPAFAGQLGFFVNQSTLTAQSIPSLKQVWSDTLQTSDGYQTPPVVIGDIVYLGTIANTLVGYDVNTGKRKVLMNLPPSSSFQSYSGSLGFGDGELLVPNGKYLVAFEGK